MMREPSWRFGTRATLAPMTAKTMIVVVKRVRVMMTTVRGKMIAVGMKSMKAKRMMWRKERCRIARV